MQGEHLPVTSNALLTLFTVSAQEPNVPKPYLVPMILQADVASNETAVMWPSGELAPLIHSLPLWTTLFELRRHAVI